jgi:hypothetical protein
VRAAIHVLPLLAVRVCSLFVRKITWGRKEREEREREKDWRKIEKMLNLKILWEKNKR